MSTAFGCTLQGRVEPAEVLRLLQAVLDAGADRVGLADTVGYADPAMVQSLFEAAFAVAGDKLACGHFHDTRGMGIANVYAALLTGVTRFDACLAGIGGCPHAPGASGNVASEDLAYMFASMGIETGIDFDKLMALRGRSGRLAGRVKPCTARCGARACPRPCGLPPPRPELCGSLRFFSGYQHCMPNTPPPPRPPQPLAGLRVVEFTHMVMGPTCGMVLADMGAEVIKVEPADGDRTRHLLGAGSGFFPLFNRNKKSIGINLHDEAGAAVARKLCASADVVIENFKPGTMAKYGLDYAALSAATHALSTPATRAFCPARMTTAPRWTKSCR
jgi:hypothetical protein